MREVVIVGAPRTAIGSFQGSLAQVPAVELGAAVVRALVDKVDLATCVVDEVIMGQVLTAAAGQNTARQAAVEAGLPVTTPALTVNKVCGSGLKAVHLAAQSILLDDAEIVIAGGVESMSLAPYAAVGARTGLRMGHGSLIDTMLVDGLWDAFNHYSGSAPFIETVLLRNRSDGWLEAWSTGSKLASWEGDITWFHSKLSASTISFFGFATSMRP